MNKEVWVRPIANVQQFVANEYVAACITGVIQCAYPGDGKTNGLTNKFDDYNGEASGWWYENQNQPHGLCGYNAPISFNDDTASGFETINGVVQRNRVISNVSGYTAAVGTYYNVSWISNDNGGADYHHVGRLEITNIDNEHPNHS